MLTIGIPFYNNEKTLADAVKSVLIQTFTDWELILADDGSKDGSLAIAKKFAAADKRIIVISDGENKGISYRLNKIADMANGDYIARMDADDMMMPDRLEKQMKVLFADTSIDILDTAAYVINEKEEPVGMRGDWDITDWSKKKVLTKGLFFHPSVVAKTSWFRANKYAEKYKRAEDLELWYRTYDTSNFSRVYEPLFIYREGKVNVKNYIKSAQSTRHIMDTYYKGVLTTGEYRWEIFKSHLKSNLYRTFALFGLQHILSSARNEKLDNSQKEKVKRVINLIQNINQEDLKSAECR
jgi:glycosyltransferase involved in cell wall biosynthesis